MLQLENFVNRLIHITIVTKKIFVGRSNRKNEFDPGSREC